MADENSAPLTTVLIEAIRGNDLVALERAIAAAAPGDLDSRDERGFTPLLWAIREEWLEAVEQLLSAGADPNIGGSRVDYPLSASFSRGQPSIAVRLLQSPSLDLPWQGFIAAYDSLLGGDLTTLNCLLEHGFDLSGPVPSQTGIRGAPDCASALLFGTISIGLPRPEVFERLIALGANPNAHSGGDSMAGRLCARANESPPVLRQLLQNGAMVDELDASGFAPLHYAAARDHLESVRLLLEFGATPNLQAADGSFPLLWSASNELGRVHALLLESLPANSETDNAHCELPPYWHWNGGAAWGALELAGHDGAWHGVLWAEDEEKLLSGLQQRYASQCGSSPLCLVIRQLRSPQHYPPIPYLQPSQSNVFKVDQTFHLHHYAPWFVQGISRPPAIAEYHRFVLTREANAAGQSEACLVEIRQIVSYYEGWVENHASGQCQLERQHWRLVSGE